MDESFAELSRLLNFRDKEQERIQKREARMKGELSQEEKEMDDWDKEMKVRVLVRISSLDYSERVHLVASSFFDTPRSWDLIRAPNHSYRPRTIVRRTYSNAR
jgi:hypothetical protein